MCRLPRILTAVPQSWPVRIEIMKAVRTLAAECEDAYQGRRAELAALRRDCELLAEAIRETRRSFARPDFARISHAGLSAAVDGVVAGLVAPARALPLRRNPRPRRLHRGHGALIKIKQRHSRIRRRFHKYRCRRSKKFGLSPKPRRGGLPKPA